MITLSKGELATVWKAIDLQTPYNWPVRPKAAARLERLTAKVCGQSNRDELVTALGPLLASENKHEVAKWIIQDWGGIRRASTNTIAMMVAGLGDYSDAVVEAFVIKHGCNRIPSWSKLLAFRDGRRWAIYDSRTAVALNVALMAAGREPSFVMPPSRNTKIEPRRRTIAAKQYRPSALGYPEYLSVLRALCDFRNLSSIGNVEMVLFANAEAIVSS